MLPVYCVHHSPLTERRKYIESSPVGFCQFITIDQEFNKNAIFEMYNPSPELWNKRCEGLYKEIPPYRELKIGDLGCAVNHIQSLNHASSNEGVSLIIEDDAIFTNNFWKPVKKLLAFRQGFFQWDVAIIGGAFDHTVSPTIVESKDFSTDRIILKGNPATNTVCGYMITGTAAIKLQEKLITEKIVLPIDFEYNYWFRELNFRVVHYVPYPIIEGSSQGYYKGNQVR